MTKALAIANLLAAFGLGPVADSKSDPYARRSRGGRVYGGGSRAYGGPRPGSIEAVAFRIKGHYRTALRVVRGARPDPGPAAAARRAGELARAARDRRHALRARRRARKVDAAIRGYLRDVIEPMANVIRARLVHDAPAPSAP